MPIPTENLKLADKSRDNSSFFRLSDFSQESEGFHKEAKMDHFSILATSSFHGSWGAFPKEY